MTKIRFDRSIYRDWPIGLGVALVAFGFYLATLAPAVLQADSGEFQFVAWLPGIAHPPGYPLYILLGWLWTHTFAVGEVAWRMNLLSAIFAAITVGLAYGLAKKIFCQARPHLPPITYTLAAGGAALIFALTPTFWSQAIIAEVYSLHGLFVVLILTLTINVRQVRPDLETTSFKLLSLSLGLSLTHHVTIVLLFPALALYLLWPQPDQTHDTWRLSLPQNLTGKNIVIHTLLFLLPLALYLYLPAVAPGTPYSTVSLNAQQSLVLYEHSVTGFFNHVLATVFTTEIQPAAVGTARFLLVGQFLLEQVGWSGLSLALVGLATLFWQGPNDLLLLSGLSALGVIIFNLIYFIGDVFVLFIPVWLIITLWLGLGVLVLGQMLAGQFVKRKTNSPEMPLIGNLARRLESSIYRLIMIALLVIIFGVLIGLQVSHLPSLSQANNRTAKIFWESLLAEDIPQNAILISNDRNEIMPLWYYQFVEQRRPDLQGLFPLIVTDPAYTNIGRVLDQALATGRPVYLIKPMEGLELKARLTPHGKLFEATQWTETPANRIERVLPEVVIQDKAENIILLGYDLVPAVATPGQEITITLYWQTSQPLSINYTSYIHLLDDQGQGITQSDHQPGGNFYPSSYWQPGEILRDRHVLQLPSELATGRYPLRAGLYYQPEPGYFVGMGAGEIIGDLQISR